MEASPASSPSAPPPAAPHPKPSSTRLIVLLGILAVVLGALAYDQLMAKPNCEAADKRLELFVEERNKLGIKEGGIVHREDVQKELGFAPQQVENNDEKGYTIEHYRWWGPVPLKRHFMTVLYVGKEPRRYSSHYLSDVPEDALPGYVPKQEPVDAAAGDSGAELPGDPAPADAPAEPKPEDKPADAPAEPKVEDKSADAPPAEKSEP